MTKAIVLDPFSGVSGDMFVGALVDLGAPFEDVRSRLGRIDALAKVSARREEVMRGAVRATRIVVECPHEHEHRTLSDVRAVIESGGLSERVVEGALRTFTMLAEAEAKVHGVGVDDVHFHEVGALDAIFDIVATHVAVELLGHPRMFTRPLALGAGEAKSEHGTIPVPAPATVEMLAGYPVKFSDRGGELVTPTGASLIASLCEPLPADVLFTMERTGHGAGSRDDTPMPNVLRAMIGRIEERAAHVCIVTSTIDDMNPELFGQLMEDLFANGALEVYYSQVMMKKNRPGVEVTLIAEEGKVNELVDVLLATTTTLGVRIHREERRELARRKESVATEYGAVDVKVAERPNGGLSMSPEYESCKRVARESGVAVAEVYEAARRAWYKRIK